MIKYLRLLLLPFSILYGIVVLIRNILYDKGVFKSVRFEIPVICVGNLAVGGSGKTPVTEYLVSLLNNKRIAILSRGYGRSTKGFIMAGPDDTSDTIGDEPMQFSRKFPNVTVAVCEDRVRGISLLEANHDVVILDDAFQHRSVRPGFSILLFEYQKLLSWQFLLPAGNLREPFWGYKRADAVLVTKTPLATSSLQKQKCMRKFNDKTREHLFFSALAYSNLVNLQSSQIKALGDISVNTTIFLLTGIANPLPMLTQLKQYTKKIHHHDYPDHYNFKHRDIEKLIRMFDQNPSEDKLIITTEKDAQRLRSRALKELLLNLPVFYLPVKIALQQEDKATFDQKILNYVSGTSRNR